MLVVLLAITVPSCLVSWNVTPSIGWLVSTSFFTIFIFPVFVLIFRVPVPNISPYGSVVIA
jgi:hypothetical protein